MPQYDERQFEIADRYDLLLKKCEEYKREYESREEEYYDEDDDYEDEWKTPEEYKKDLIGKSKRGEVFVLVRYIGNDGEVQIPECVQVIMSKAFYGNKTLRKVYMPDSVQAMGDRTFSGCSSLEEVRLSKKLEAIPVEMFKDCTSLRSIKIPDSVKVIRINAFDGCSSLEEVQFSQKQNLEAIGWDVFARCPSLKCIRFPDGLKDVDQALFYDGGLEEVYIPKSLVYISPSAFQSCYSLKKVEVDPNNPSYYSRDNCIYYAQNGWMLLGRNDGTVPNDGSLKYIGDSAYECNPFVAEFNVPDGVTHVGIAAFRNCKNLRRVTLPSTVESIGRCAFEKTGLEEITVPGGVKVIRENSFSHSKLQKVILKRGVEVVETYVFSHCGELKEVYIPASVKSLYTYSTFSDCNRSMRIYLEKGAEGDYIKELKKRFDVITDCESNIFD